jgi:hypothetical protein
MQCQHPGCTCQARDGDRWCSDQCRTGGPATSANAEGDCGCGHEDCGR